MSMSTSYTLEVHIKNKDKSPNHIDSYFMATNAKSFKKFTDDGNFTGHISKMIAGFAEKQSRVAESIVKGLKAKSFLDIGASEGGLAKAVGENLPESRVVAVDPNRQMKENFDKTLPIPRTVTLFPSGFPEGKAMYVY